MHQLGEMEKYSIFWILNSYFLCNIICQKPSKLIRVFQTYIKTNLQMRDRA